MALNGYEKLADLTAQDARIEALRDELDRVQDILALGSVADAAAQVDQIGMFLTQDQAWEENRQFDIRRENGEPELVTRTSYFTFGAGTPLRGRYVHITAVEPEWPHEKMLALFGNRWSTEYPLDWGNRSNVLLDDFYSNYTRLELTGVVLTAIEGGELPEVVDVDYATDVEAVRAHMTQDLSKL